MSDWQSPDPLDRHDSHAPPPTFPPPEAADRVAEPDEEHPGAPDESDAPAPVEDEWLRLDPRMLLLGPVSALKQVAVPALIAVVGISSSRGGFSWWFLPVAAIAMLAIGLIPWLTTRYRFTDTQFQRRSGLFSKKQLTARLDRVRSVDIEATLLHRMLGLATVKVGTGVDDTQIELNSLNREQAHILRQTLLARARSDAPAAPADPDVPIHDEESRGATDPTPAVPTPEVEAAPEEVLATLDWSWVRFAPLNLALLAVAAAALGFMSQFINDIPMATEDRARDAWEQLSAVAIPLLVIALLLGGLVLWIAISIVGYALRWSGMRLTRDQETVRLTAGLLTTRSTSVEEKRIRGVRLTQPALMRVFRGAELATLATGVGSGGTSSVMPPSPLRENERVAGLLLEDDEPMRTPVVPHGPYARRRIHLRRQWWTVFLTAVVAVLVWQLGWPWWPVPLLAVLAAMANVLLAEMTYRLLGHALTRHHLVSREGSLTSRRTVLERDGIIGWVVSQSFFQRRVGLVTLIATTAAGGEKMVVRDVPEPTGIAVAADITSEAVVGFLADQAS